MVVYDYFVEFSDSNQLKQYRKKKSEYQYDKSQAMPSFLSGVNIGINLFDKLFIRNKMHNIKFHEEIKIGEDLYFIFEFLKNVDCVYGKSKAGYHYLQRSGSAMNGKFSENEFEKVKDRVKWKQTKIEDSMQPALIKPFERPENREKFWQDFENDTFDSIAKEYGGYTFSNKIKYKLKKEKQRLMKR